MFTRTLCTLISGFLPYSPTFRTIPRKINFHVSSRRQFNQRLKPVDPLIYKFRSKRQTHLGISGLTSRKDLFHHSCRFANQISSGLKTDQSLGAKLKRLSREYGWSAFGVYLTLSALDFPLSYLLVKYLGSERIGEWEQVITSQLKSLIPEDLQRTYTEWSASIKNIKDSSDSTREDIGYCEKASNSVEEAEKNNKKDASLATQLALAYAIHKTFIFVRVPLTAAITPKIVRILRGWGWDIGKRTTKETKVLNSTNLSIKTQKPIIHQKKSL